MTIRYEYDERLDPIIASEAAAKFLRQNYEKLGSWPLAITAYNHGPQSLLRITKRMGTHDLAHLIEAYDGRRFKFASKNFYAEFLAAREVAQDYRRYFGELEMERPLLYEEVELPFYLDAAAAAQQLGVTTSVLKKLNPALRHSVWSGSKLVPRGVRLRLPHGTEPAVFLASLPPEARSDKQKRSTVVRVVRGDTLYSIGRRHGISWRDIALANNITAYHRLRPGRKLILPWNGRKVAAPRPETPPRRQPSLAGSRIIERTSLERTAPWMGGTPVVRGGSAATHFQELAIVHYDPTRQDGEIMTAYGETLGYYADWAGVSVAELRRLNAMSSRSLLRPGRSFIIPLDKVTPEEFDGSRLEFHREREANFFAQNSITEVVKIEVRRGQSSWDLAQGNDIPMWLFYRENPSLLREPLRAGMKVTLPIVRPEGGGNSRAALR